MNLRPFLLVSAITLGLGFHGCNTDKDDDDNNGTYKPPTLDFEFEVTGDLTMSESFTSPENSNVQGGHQHAVISGQSSASNYWSITGNGQTDDGTTYTFTVAFEASSVSSGTYTVTQAQFGTTQSGFPELVGGTVNITSAALGQELPVGSFHSASGNFTVSLENQNTPAGSITFTATFTGLHVTSA